MKACPELGSVVCAYRLTQSRGIWFMPLLPKALLPLGEKEVLGSSEL